MNVPPQLLHQLPLLAIFVVPVTSAYFGLTRINMKSAIHFQQGTRGSSAWRAALTMSTLTIPSFAFWCLLLRGPSALAYQLGFSLAIVVVFCSVASILHYVPSPSLFAYPQLRFQSSNLRFALSILQTVVTFLCILLVLLHSSSMLASVSLFSLYLCVALVAFFPLFAVVFSGYSSIMTLSLVLHTFCILFGIGVFLVFGIKDVTSFRTIVPYEFTMSDAVLSLFVGFIVSLYQLTSSPLLYQAYFPIPTLYKLRLTLVFHGVFQLFSSILVFLTISLFYAFLEKNCSLSFSYQTLFQFAKYTVPHPALAYAVIVSFLSVFTFCIQWLYMCITTHVWEEFVKVHLRDLGSMKQLCCLQSILLLICAISVSIVSAIRFFQIPYDILTPSLMLSILTICAGMCGIFMCGYFLPFCNSRGALTSLIITTISSLCLFYLYASHNTLPTLKSSCSAETVANSTVLVVQYGKNGVDGISNAFIFSSNRRFCDERSDLSDRLVLHRRPGSNESRLESACCPRLIGTRFRLQ
ncbi:hypothetical protein RB195_016561 [Necator americanus]|uniref:Uncharacterized protein n=1 Tax=Necator americanus TaxID=51031 RepID=A0ABR1C104_NECAM